MECQISHHLRSLRNCSLLIAMTREEEKGRERDLQVLRASRLGRLSLRSFRK